jgi:hypothetical protein
VHQVPPDAIVQDFPMRTFADMRKAMSGNEMKDRTFPYMGNTSEMKSEMISR